jgi:hypothetical protein
MHSNFSRIIVLGMAVAATLLLGAAASASAGTLDQQQTTFNTEFGQLGPPAAVSDAQTFTAGISGLLDQADLHLSKTGAAPDVTVEIRSTSGGSPTAAVLATGTIPASAIGTTAAFVPVVFATPPSVSAGTLYALVAYSPGTASKKVSWSGELANAYPSGQLFYSNDPLPPGANWNAENNDFTFRTYVVPTPPTPPIPPPPPSTPSASTSTGLQAAALKQCKKRAKTHSWSKDRLKKCKKKARLLPV